MGRFTPIEQADSPEAQARGRFTPIEDFAPKTEGPGLVDRALSFFKPSPGLPPSADEIGSPAVDLGPSSVMEGYAGIPQAPNKLARAISKQFDVVSPAQQSFMPGPEIRDVGVSPTLPNMLADYGGTFGRTAQGLKQGVRQTFADVAGIPSMSRDATRRAAQVQLEEEAATPQIEDPTLRALYSVPKSIIQTAPALALGAVSQPLALTAMAAQQAFPKYAEFREKDPSGSKVDQFLNAAAQGTIEAGTELFALNKLIKLFGRPGFRTLVGFAGSDLLGEQAATLGENLFDAVEASRKDPKAIQRFKDDIGDNAYQTLVSSLGQTLLMGGAAKAVNLARGGNASEVRSDETQLPSRGLVPEVGGGQGGQNLQLPTPEGIRPDGTQLRSQSQGSEVARRIQEITGVTPEPVQPVQPTSRFTPIEEVQPAPRETPQIDRTGNANLLASHVGLQGREADLESRLAANDVVVPQDRTPIEEEVRKPGPLVDPRLQSPDLTAELQAMADNSGWDEVGGRMIRAPDEGGLNPEVIGRTPWIAKEEWYSALQSDPKTKIPGGKSGVQAAVRKALAGERMSTQERRAVRFMLNQAEDEKANRSWVSLEDFRGLNQAEGLPATMADILAEDNLAHLDTDTLERLAIQYENDERGFHAAVENLQSSLTSQALGQRGPEGQGLARRAAEPAQTYPNQAALNVNQRDLFGADLQGQGGLFDRGEGLPGRQLEPASSGPSGKPASPVRSGTAVHPGRTVSTVVARPIAGGVKPRPRVIAKQVADSFERGHPEALLGKVVHNAEDVATLGQIYRDPKIETFRVIFTKGGKIVDMTAVSSREANASTAFLPNEDATRAIGDRMQANGADGYWMMHNHPSGQPTPSNGDLLLTGYVANRAPGFLGHVIINSNAYGVVDMKPEPFMPGQRPEGKVVQKQFSDDSLLNPRPAFNWQGTAVIHPRVVAQIGKSLQLKDQWVGVIVQSGRSGVRTLAEMPIEILNDPIKATAWLRRLSIGTGGGGNIFLYFDNPVSTGRVGETLMKLYEAQVIEDAVSSKWSLAEKVMTPRGEKQMRAGSTKRVAQEESEYNVGPWYYSELARQASAVKWQAAPVQHWRDWVRSLSTKGVKKDELEATGLDDWLQLQTGKVTKQQVQEYLDANGVQVEETTLGEGAMPPELAAYMRAVPSTPTDAAGWLERSASFERQAQKWKSNGDENQSARFFRLSEQANEMAERLETDLGKAHGETKFSQWQLTGGENYRELLLTLPVDQNAEAAAKSVRLKELIAERDQMTAAFHRTPMGSELRAEATRQLRNIEARINTLMKRTEPQTAFRSSHFDQPNILAHVRFNERTDADGKRVLFIEEVQSDWAQKGKREGFTNPGDRDRDRARELEIRDKMSALAADRDPVTNRIRDEAGWHALASQRGALDRKLSNAGTITAAPFVQKTEAWTALALKRMIRYAAENGFDRVAWTTGEQQAARYDLSKQVDKIVVTPRTNARTNERTRSVAIGLKSGRVVTLGVDAAGVVDNANEDLPGAGDVIGKPLADVLGKDIAETIMQSERATIEGEGLKVGGRGMQVFYDKIIPNVANDVLKKLGGGRVGTTSIPVAPRPKSLAWMYEWAEKAHPAMSRSDVAKAWSEGEKNAATREFMTYAEPMEQPGFDITPAVREKAMGGLPVFEQELPYKTGRDSLRWDSIDQTERGDRFMGQGFILDPVRELKVGSGLGGELPVGHAAHVQKGNTVVEYTIRDGQQKDIGSAILELDQGGDVAALHDIELSERKSGLGSQIIGQLAANNGPIRIVDMVPDARPFWNKVGVGYIDAYGNGSLDWQSYSEATRRPARSVEARGQARTADQGPGTKARTEPAAPVAEEVREEYKPSGLGAIIDPVTGRLKAGEKAYSAIEKFVGGQLAKIGLASNVPPAFRKLLQRYRTDKGQALEKAGQVAKAGSDLSAAERSLISDYIEQEVKAGVVPPSHVVEIAKTMDAAIAQQTKELVELGALTPEAAQKWAGRYLPRFYAKHMGAPGLINKLFRIGVKGSHLKARGLFEIVDKSDLVGWKAQGFEVREDIPTGNKDQVVVWRDWTKGEREKMGEIRDGVYRFARGMLETGSDIASLRLFQTIAKSEFATSNAAQALRDGWVKVPDQEIEGTQLKKYGKLSGMYVPKEVWKELSFEFRDRGPWETSLAQLTALWKEGKTAMNPATHSANVVSNILMADFAGVSPILGIPQYVSAMKDFRNEGPSTREAMAHGLFGGEAVSELKQWLPDPGQLNAKGPGAIAALFNTKAATMLGKYSGASFYRENMRKLYGAEDAFFKLLIFRHYRDNGMSADKAVDEANRYIFDYRDLPPTIQRIRDNAIGIPFISYTYKAIPAIVHSIMTRPWVVAKYSILFNAINALAFAMGGDDDEEFERKNMPDYMKGWTPLFFPTHIRMQDDAAKNPQYLNIARLTPLGTLFQPANGEGVPMLQGFTPNHPIYQAILTLGMNRNALTGGDFFKKSEDFEDRLKKGSKYLFQQLAPATPVVPGTQAFDKLMNGVANAVGTPVAGYTGKVQGRSGREETLPKALANTVAGVNLRGFDPEQQKTYKTLDVKREMGEIRSNIKRESQNQGITPEQKKARIEHEKQKINKLKEALQEAR